MATSKGRAWEILHSLWILWTFTLGFFNWVAFFYVGIRAKKRRWILWGAFYSIPFVLAMFVVDSAGWDGFWGNLTVVLTLVLGVMSIVHAFRIRSEYLQRLEALQRGAAASLGTLPGQAAADGTTQTGGATIDSGAQRPQSSRVGQMDQQQQSESFTQARNPTSDASTGAPAVDLNNSSEEEIASLPGVGVIIAKRAMTKRDERGGFRSVEDFGEALSLKPHVVERIRPLVYVSPRQQPGRSSSPGRVVDF